MTAYTGPDVALVAVLVLVLRRLDLGSLEGLEIVNELDFLVEDLLGVVAAEELGFYKAEVSREKSLWCRRYAPIMHTPAWVRMSFS